MSTNKHTRLIQFIIRVPLTWYLLYLAFIQNSEGAYNLVHALAWVGVMLSLLLLQDAVKPNLRKHPNDWIYTVAKIDDFIIAGVFIWFGSIATGIAWLVAAMISICAKEIAVKEGNEEA